MSLAYRRLVRLIEINSDQLANSLLRKLQTTEKCKDFCKVPPEELRQRVYEIYKNLGDWLLSKTEADIEKRYCEIGRWRAQQAVPLSQVIWAITLVKENLLEFLQRETIDDKVHEVFDEVEVTQMLDQFFNYACFYAAVGYETAVAAHAAAGK